MSNQVIIKDAVKRYGDFTALNGVSLTSTRVSSSRFWVRPAAARPRFCA